MRFLFGNQEIDSLSGLLSKIKDCLSQEDFLEIQQINYNTEEFFHFLYYNFGEEFIKYYFASYFEIDCFQDEIESMNDIDLQYLSFYQKHSFIICKLPNKVKIIIDYLSEELWAFIENHLAQYEEIEFCFAIRKNLLNKICSISKESLLDKAINTNHAAKDLSFSTKKNLLTISLCCFLFFLLSFKFVYFAIAIICIGNIFYFASASYKLYLSYIKNEVIEKNQEYIVKEYPIYTILLPVYYEDRSIILQLISAIKNLNYPMHQLDVKFLIEENDLISARIIESMKFDYNFDIINIPHQIPKTKARACNYGFNFAKGKFLVIYDADDIPHPNQLNEVLENFGGDFDCIQCLLNSYNHQENLLTKFYSMDFDLWYKVFLPSMNKKKLPVTFGGTSNHFRVDVLKKNLWDPYNVTEDADLGIRWFLANHKVKIISSLTLEEAPTSIKVWIGQRSRWIKGFIQTYFVHSHEKKIFIWLNLFVATPIIAQLFFIPIIFEFLLLKFYFKEYSLLKHLGDLSLLLFFIIYIIQLIPILINRKKFLTKIDYKIIFFPMYSMFNIIASYKAIIQFFTKPFYWEKTMHGLTKDKLD